MLKKCQKLLNFHFFICLLCLNWFPLPKLKLFFPDNLAIDSLLWNNNELAKPFNLDLRMIELPKSSCKWPLLPKKWFFFVIVRRISRRTRFFIHKKIIFDKKKLPSVRHAICRLSPYFIIRTIILRLWFPIKKIYRFSEKIRLFIGENPVFDNGHLLIK
jgi:hypothetical protein